MTYFKIELKENPTLIIKGDIEKLDDEAIEKLVVNYLEGIFFFPKTVKKGKEHIIVELEPQTLNF